MYEEPKYLSAKVTIKDGDHFSTDLIFTVQLIENSEKSELVLQFFIDDGSSDSWDLKEFLDYFKRQMSFKFTEF